MDEADIDGGNHASGSAACPQGSSTPATAVVQAAQDDQQAITEQVDLKAPISSAEAVGASRPAQESASATSAAAQGSARSPAPTSSPLSAKTTPTTTSAIVKNKSAPDEDAKDEQVALAAAKAARESAKKKRFMLAQAMHQKMLDANKENSYQPRGDIHGVDCRQFSTFFQVLLEESTEQKDPITQNQVVRVSRTQRESGLSVPQESGILSKLRALEEARMLRRSNLVDLGRVVMADLTKLDFWFPNSWDPASRFFNYQVCNPYASDIEAILTVRGQYLEVVTNAEEHAHCSKAFPDSSGTGSAQLPAVPRRVQQADSGEPQSLGAYGGSGDAAESTHEVLRYSVSIQRRRTICVFFKYVGDPELGAHGIPCRLPIASSSRDVRAMQTAAWSKCKVSVHYRESLLEILQLEIRPQPMIPTRSFRIYLGQGQRFSGLLPLERHEVGKMVRVHSPAQNRLILLSADFWSKAKCMDSSDQLLGLAAVDSGSWPVHAAQPTLRDADVFGAVRLCLDASGEIA